MHFQISPVHDLAALLAPLSLGIAWFLPAIATGIANLFGAFGAKKQRNEQQRQIDQRWQQYVSDWRKWRDQDNARKDALSQYITNQGWDDRLGDLKAKIVAHTIGEAPNGSAPKVQGSFFNDFLGQTAAALPQLMLSFGSHGGFPGGANGQVLGQALAQGLSQIRPGATSYDPTTGAISPPGYPSPAGPGGFDTTFGSNSTFPTSPYGAGGGGDPIDDQLAAIYQSGFGSTARR